MDWRKVPVDLKDKVCSDVKKRFEYPPDQFNEDLCKGHAMVIVSKALHSLRSKLNKNYMQKGKTPSEDYNFIKHHVWEEFVEKNEYQRSKGQE